MSQDRGSDSPAEDITESPASEWITDLHNGIPGSRRAPRCPARLGIVDIGIGALVPARVPEFQTNRGARRYARAEFDSRVESVGKRITTRDRTIFVSAGLLGKPECSTEGIGQNQGNARVKPVRDPQWKRHPHQPHSNPHPMNAFCCNGAPRRQRRPLSQRPPRGVRSRFPRLCFSRDSPVQFTGQESQAR